MVDAQVGVLIRRFLRQLQQTGLPVAFGVLYGSYARGTPQEDDDIDLLVVSPHFDHVRQWSDMHLLCQTAGSIDSRIEPIGIGSREWAEDQQYSGIALARNEGIVIALDDGLSS